MKMGEIKVITSGRQVASVICVIEAKKNFDLDEVISRFPWITEEEIKSLDLNLPLTAYQKCPQLQMLYLRELGYIKIRDDIAEERLFSHADDIDGLNLNVWQQKVDADQIDVLLQYRIAISPETLPIAEYFHKKPDVGPCLSPPEIWG